MARQGATATMPTNQDHADRLIAEAVDLAARRRALLCAAVLLTTTSTVTSAIRALAEWDGPDVIRSDAAAVLAGLDATTR